MVSAFAVFALGLAQSTGALNPDYHADGVVNAASVAAGPLAPQTIASIYGRNLSWVTAAADASSRTLPLQLGGVRVWVNGSSAPLLYVSPLQINFVTPPNLLSGLSDVQVFRDGVVGPAVKVPVAVEAPELFRDHAGFAIAGNTEGTLLSRDRPGRPATWAILFATGLGPTRPSQLLGQALTTPAEILRARAFQVFLNDKPVPRDRIPYVGATPGFVGLYQINVLLPDDLPADPEIRLGFDHPTSLAGVKLHAIAAAP